MNKKEIKLKIGHRSNLYEDYASSFKNSGDVFDYESAEKWGPYFRYITRNWLPEDKNASIIDLGCGDGRIIYLLKRMGYSNIEGVDISKSQIKLAHQIDDRVSEGDILDHLRNTSNKYNLILAFDVIEHLTKEEALEFIRLCLDKLGEGGRLILQTPNACSPFFGSVRYGDLTHELGFTPKLLTQLLQRTGYQYIEAREAGPMPYGHSLVSTMRYMLWQILRRIYYFIDMVEVGGSGNSIYTRVFVLSGTKQI